MPDTAHTGKKGFPFIQSAAASEIGSLNDDGKEQSRELVMAFPVGGFPPLFFSSCSFDVRGEEITMNPAGKKIHKDAWVMPCMQKEEREQKQK